MRGFVLLLLVVACTAAPGTQGEDEGKLELFSGVFVEKWVLTNIVYVLAVKG